MSHPKPTPPAPATPPAPTPPAPPAAPVNFVDEKGKTWNFPANTPVDSMTADQKAEYWREKAKKHEKNRRPDDFDQIAADAAAHRAAQQAGLPADQQALAAAKAEGQAEGRSALLVDAVTSLLRAEAPNLTEEEADEIVEDLDLSKFAGSDGRLDRERVKKLAEKHVVTTDAAPGTQARPGDPLAQALAHQAAPGASGPSAGSVSSLREQVRDSLTKKK